MTVQIWIAIALFLALMGTAVVCRRLTRQLEQASTETARLRSRLSTVRQELVEVNARRKKLLAASTQALIIVEHDNKISSANKVAKRLFGKLNWGVTLMAWTRQHQLQELVNQTLQGEKAPPLYFSMGDRNLEANARWIKENKEIVAVALAIYDVTQLHRLTRARRDFIANISHELRTPLASLQLLTETLLNGALDDREVTNQLVTRIAVQVDSLSQIAQEVLDLSLIESGKAPLKMGICPLNPIVQEQLERLTPQACRKNLTLINSVDQELTVLVDTLMIGRVITNLVHNAIKFTEKGEVTIDAHWSSGSSGASEPDSDGEWVTVTVSDTGSGIAAEELPRIFERFYKIDPARNRQEAGTGLGLAIARHIVEAHGGTIWATSSNAGATFYFTLPVE